MTSTEAEAEAEAEAADLLDAQDDIPVLSPHPSGDVVLTILASDSGATGHLVRAFPGASGEATSAWIDEWFLERTRALFAGQDGLVGSPVPSALIDRAAENVGIRRATPARLLSVEPHYFRGFRELAEPIDCNADLVAFDGKNSAGKTSLAEALEWLFTGALSRRALRAHGVPRELENCVGNVFRPEDEETWVEATFRLDDGSTRTLRRVLVEDYGASATAHCRSRVLLDGRELSDEETHEELEALFGGSAPLLMQHTLRLFVQSEPGERRTYFEHLLQLDELTALIEKAVVGTRAHQMVSPTGSVASKQWQGIKAAVRLPASTKALRRIEKLEPERIAEAVGSILPGIATAEFDGLTPHDESLAAAIAAVEHAQRAARQQSLPLLGTLRPTRTVDASLLATLDPRTLTSRLGALREAIAARQTANDAADQITAAQLAVADAVAQLTTAGLLPITPEEPLTCPLCLAPERPTLTPERLGEVRGWEPARAALAAADDAVLRAANQLLTYLKEIRSVRVATVPEQPTDEAWNEATMAAPAPVQEATEAFRSDVAAVVAGLTTLDNTLRRVGKALNDAIKAKALTGVLLDAYADDLDALGTALPVAVEHARRYAASAEAIERAVGARAASDEEYARRDLWLAVATAPDALASDIAWERAKEATTEELRQARGVLMDARRELLERRRADFNDGMTDVWRTLRADRYSAFSQLHIPEPRGRGFPIAIEVKALLDDGRTKQEVDALRVFSESQVNVLGIAAFITRAKLLGHRLLVFDDPVQSMDEDHFLTFAKDLLTHLLDAGFQVILLTHNDTFARDVSFAHCDRESYATIEIAHARKSGCRVERDSRRMSERLRRADKAAEDGDLSTAWKLARLAIERFCVVTYIKHGPPGFKPATWADQTGEYMLNAGVGTIISAKSSPDNEALVRDALRMTAAGAHDKAARGFTDVANAIKDICRIAASLSVKD